MNHRRRHRLRLIQVVAIVLCTGALATVGADPPEWAPAHGEGGKHKHHHRHDHDDSNDNDDDAANDDHGDGDGDHREHHRHDGGGRDMADRRFGVLDGQCNRDAIGAMLGGVAGGIIGNQVGQGDVAATAVGTLLGAALGTAVGAKMDAADRACTHQVLQYAEENVPVSWRNGATTYVVTPLAVVEQRGRHCRNVLVVATSNGRTVNVRKRACRGTDANWLIDD